MTPPKAAPLPSRFRFASSDTGGPRTGDELATLLQSRLRLIATVGLFMLGLFVALNTTRLLFNATGDYRAIALRTVLRLGPQLPIYLWAWWWLRPATPRPLLSLRRWELVSTFGMMATVVVNLLDDFPTIVPYINDAPIDLGMGSAALMSLAIVSYGVLIPNTWRRCVRVVGVLVLAVFVTEAWNFSQHPVAFASGATFLASQTCILLAFSAYAVFGAYRLEAAANAARDALKLGQYVLVERLGAGGMGEVHRAEHSLLRRPCAVKLIRPEHAGNPDVLRRFEREVQATAALTHPNTVAIYDYGISDDGTFYYVMEYLPGDTLEQLVAREGPLAPARAVHILRQVAGALDEAHRTGLTHRDIKPGNVMVCERGGIPDVAKLLDFGLVVTRDANADATKITQAGIIVGTPAYMSPEQCAGEEQPGPASDLYSLGALGYFLVTGRSPFEGKPPVQMLMAHLGEAPASARSHRADVPEALDIVLLRCLAKKPGERYASAAELERALATIAV